MKISLPLMNVLTNFLSIYRQHSNDKTQRFKNLFKILRIMMAKYHFRKYYFQKIIPSVFSSKRKAIKNEPFEYNENDPKEYQCYYCGEMIISVKNVKDHMREKHRRFHSKMFGDPRPYSCHSCGATFNSEKTKSNHMCTNVDFPVLKDAVSGSFKCQHCSKTFDRRKGYIYHVVNTHKAERNFACNECNYKAKNQMLLTRHVNRLHKQVKPYLCPHCGKAFYDSWNMKNHVKRLHLGEQIKKPVSKTNPGAAPNAELLQCEHCGKDYSSPSALATHVKVQHENVTYNCDRCGKMFRYIF